jgi:hypothetical protein
MYIHSACIHQSIDVTWTNEPTLCLVEWVPRVSGRFPVSFNLNVHDLHKEAYSSNRNTGQVRWCRKMKWSELQWCKFTKVQNKAFGFMKFRVFWDVAPCSLVEDERHFRGAYCLHHKGDDNGGSTHLWNVTQLQRDYTALNLRRL